MYAFLRGKLAEKDAERAVVDVGGVGYDIVCSRGALSRMGNLGDDVTVYTCLIVREDEMSLYGFQSPEEKRMFLRLTSVSGVGPKMGLAILSGLGVSDLALALATGDEKRLSSISGVGKKTAQRLILELNEKVAAALSQTDTAIPVLSTHGPVQEAVAALVALGYSPSEAASAAAANPGSSVEEIIKRVLSSMDAARR